MQASSEPTIREQKNFWDWHWQHWQDRRTINEWKDRRHNIVLDMVASLSLDQARILDVGCGPGWYTAKLARFGQVTGIDLSEEAISMARQRFPNINFIAGNLYEVDLPAEHFDVIVSQEVIDHVEDQVLFVDRVARALKPGGYLVLSCANKFVMDRLGDEFPVQPAAHIGRYFSIKGLKALLSSHFRILRFSTVIPIGRRGILRMINSEKVTAVLGNTIKEKFGLGYQIILLAQKRS